MHNPPSLRSCSSRLQPLKPLHSLSPSLLDIVPRVRPSRSALLTFRHRSIHLGYIHQFFYPHNLTGDGLCDGVVDGRHAFAETEGFEHTLYLFRHANSGAHQCYAKVGHCERRNELNMVERTFSTGAWIGRPGWGAVEVYERVVGLD
jgi:hypothetical protein